jgi:hypothetical protein
MNAYATALEKAWEHLLLWNSDGKFSPRAEEDIQCFLYHALVLQLGTARGISPKPTSGKDGKNFFLDGKLHVGNMHFPDLLVGPDGGEPEVAVEIKFKRKSRGTIYPSCLTDVEKLAKLHSARLQYFILFDEHSDHVFLDQYQFDQLRGMAHAGCKIMMHPTPLNPSIHKIAARKAIDTQRKAGVDFVKRGVIGAQKAMKGKASAP